MKHSVYIQVRFGSKQSDLVWVWGKLISEVVDPCFIHCHMLSKNLFFVASKQLQTTLWIVDVLFLIDCEHSFLIDKYSCKMVNTLPSDIFNSSLISYNSNLELAKPSLWSYLVFSGTTVDFGRPEHSASLCVCMTGFKVSIPPLNSCFWQSRAQITLIKPLLCLNSIFPIRKQSFINIRNYDFPIFFKKFATVASRK